MSFLFGSPQVQQPTPPAMPPPPPAAHPSTMASAGIQAASVSNGAKAAGAMSTVATSPQGVSVEPQTSRATLLG